MGVRTRQVRVHLRCWPWPWPWLAVMGEVGIRWWGKLPCTAQKGFTTALEGCAENWNISLKTHTVNSLFTHTALLKTGVLFRFLFALKEKSFVLYWLSQNTDFTVDTNGVVFACCLSRSAWFTFWTECVPDAPRASWPCRLPRSQVPSPTPLLLILLSQPCTCSGGSIPPGLTTNVKRGVWRARRCKGVENIP